MRAIVALAAGTPAVLTEVSDPVPGDGEVLLRVSHSSLNYKDGMAVTGSPGIIRRWPLVLGIDAVGIVEESRSEEFAPGDRVVLNGAGAGESRDGGFAEWMVAAAGSLLHVSDRLESRHAAAVGTAGFTAALAVLALEDHGVVPGDGEVLVTGAAGGVGSIAVSLLARRGHAVVASTGRAESQSTYLKRLGAHRVIDRAELAAARPAPLQERRWRAVVDGVGSHTLANAVAQIHYGGIAVSYGAAQGADLPGTVLPYILRAVTLAGANSVDAPLTLRRRAWAVLEQELDLEALESMSTLIGLADVPQVADAILLGQVRGRTVVEIDR